MDTGNLRLLNHVNTKLILKLQAKYFLHFLFQTIFLFFKTKNSSARNLYPYSFTVHNYLIYYLKTLKCTNYVIHAKYGQLL